MYSPPHQEVLFERSLLVVCNGNFCWLLTTGTTLTQEIVYLLKNKLAFEEARNKDMDERFPFLDWYDPVMPLFRGFKYVQELPSPRLIKSHLHYHCLPEALMKSNCKVTWRPYLGFYTVSITSLRYLRNNVVSVVYRPINNSLEFWWFTQEGRKSEWLIPT